MLELPHTGLGVLLQPAARADSKGQRNRVVPVGCDPALVNYALLASFP